MYFWLLGKFFSAFAFHILVARMALPKSDNIARASFVLNMPTNRYTKEFNLNPDLD